MDATRLCLLPHPQRMTMTGGVHRPREGATVFADGPVAQQAGRLVAEALATTRGPLPLTMSRGDDSTVPGAIVRIDPAQVARLQGYRLQVRPDQIRLISHDAAGAYYGAMTLRQIVRQSRQGTPLPCLQIDDWPDFPHRGVMLDISRDKAPTLSTLRGLVDLLAEWKVNQFQLYTEHTFAYRRHRTVWERASPLTADDVRELDAHCRERHVELVPNQNTFGHFERWLRRPAYRDLSECPDGFEQHGRRREPTTLNPLDPRSIELVGELLDELLPHFASRQVNVGCDETWELGQGRSRAACQRQGVGRVYLDFLRQINAITRRHGRTMQFWGDIILHHPALIAELPDDAIALAWGYEADAPFARDCPRFAEAGVPFYVCPGTSSWNSFLGRSDNALANIASAAEHGLAHGAVGLLNTDWGDNGHHQPPAVSWPGYAYGAAASWSLRASGAIDLARALDLHAFHDAAGVMGRAVLDLGEAYQPLQWPGRNGNWFHAAMVRPGFDLTTVTIEHLDAAERRLVEPVQRMVGAKMDRPDAQQIVAELSNAAALARQACQRARAAIAPDAAAQRAALAGELQSILKAYRRLWLARNGPGGLDDSVARFNHLLQ